MVDARGIHPERALTHRDAPDPAHAGATYPNTQSTPPVAAA